MLPIWGHVKAKLSITISKDTLRKVDRERGIANRSNYIEYLVELGLNKKQDKFYDRFVTPRSQG